MSSKRIGVAIAVVALTLSGCASVFKQKSVTSHDMATAKPGLAYWLPTAAFRVRLEVTKTKEGHDVALSVTPQAVPDTEAGLRFLEHQELATASDDLSLSVDTQGLLSTVNSDVDDQTGDIISKLVQTAINVMKIVSGVPIPIPRPMAPVGRPPLPEQLERLLGVHEWMAFRDGFPLQPDGTRIHKLDGGSSISFEIESRGDTAACESSFEACASNPSAADGIHYRVAVPYSVRAELQVPHATGTFRQVTAMVAAVPGEQVFALPFERVDFVRAVRKATFTGGMLTRLEINRPSPALGFVEIPLDVTSRILQLPGELLTLQVKSTQDQAALVEAQNKLVQQLQMLEAAKNPAPPAP